MGRVDRVEELFGREVNFLPGCGRKASKAHERREPNQPPNLHSWPLPRAPVTSGRRNRNAIGYAKGARSYASYAGYASRTMKMETVV
jgi:hypothetical protein